MGGRRKEIRIDPQLPGDGRRRTVAGQDAGLRRERGESAEGSGHGRVVAAIEVGPADGAGEERVAREKRGRGARRAVQEKTDASRGMSRSR